MTVLDKNKAVCLMGFNGIKTDDFVLIYARALDSSSVFEGGGEPQSGVLYLIELNGSARKVAYGI